MTVSSAALDGTGFILSGISFPLIVSPLHSVPFTVTFVPEAAGRYSGSISFFSDASNIPITQELTGTGLAPSQHNVSLSWDPSTSTVAGYNIYRGSRSGGPYAQLNSSPQPATSFTDSMVRNGETYFYVTTAIDADSVESAYSNEAEVAIPMR
jgi:fibronectin type 3 domain-containing protein